MVKILPIHESAKLPPNLCPILSDNLHWSEIEAAGMKSWSESARQSIKFILFGVAASSLAIGTYLGLKFRIAGWTHRLEFKKFDLVNFSLKNKLQTFPKALISMACSKIICQ